MEFTLKNGKKLLLRAPTPDDAQAMIDVFHKADSESRFLGREPGEFRFTVEQEAEVLSKVIADPDRAWFLPVCDGKVVGQASANIKDSKRCRFRHRATLGFVLVKEYWNMGIGGKMMEACLAWCREKGVEQAELTVVADNMRALRMYLSFGFRFVGRYPHALKYADGTYADEYIMVKEL